MPAVQVDYYLSLNSPWSYLGHQRFMAIANKAAATVRLFPVDFHVIFPQTGGLPVPKRSPQRQAYRLQELERWRDYLGVPMNIRPAYWPADDTVATGIVMAARDDGLDAATLAGAYMRAVWEEERNIADEHTVFEIARENGIDGEALRPRVDACIAKRNDDSLAAVERGVFGAPSYVIGKQIFWGQDRLDFVERALG